MKILLYLKSRSVITKKLRDRVKEAVSLAKRKGDFVKETEIIDRALKIGLPLLIEDLASKPNPKKFKVNLIKERALSKKIIEEERERREGLSDRQLKGLSRKFNPNRVK